MFATQTNPAPTATPLGPVPTGMRCAHREGRWIGLRDRLGFLVGDPQVVAIHGNSRRTLTDRNRPPEAPGRIDQADCPGLDRRRCVVAKDNERRRSDGGGHHGGEGNLRARTRTKRPGRRQCRLQALGGIDALGNDAHQLDGLGEVLQLDPPPFDVPHAVDPLRQVRYPSAREDLAGLCLPAEASREVERTTSVTPFDGDGLAGIEPDADRHRQLGVVDGLLDEALLQVDRGSHSLARGGEDRERLVAPQLDHLAVPVLDRLPGDPGELGSELGGHLIAALLRKRCPAADVGYQERPDVDVVSLPRDADGPIFVDHRPIMRLRAAISQATRPTLPVGLHRGE